MWVKNIFFVCEWHDCDTIPESNIRFYLNKINQLETKNAADKVEAAFVTVILQVCLTPSSPPKCTLNCLCISGELKDPQSTFPRTTCGRL